MTKTKTKTATRRNARRAMDARKKKQAKIKETYFTSWTRKPSTKRVVTFDVEAKSRDGQKAGFERAFMVGFYDGDPSKPLPDQGPPNKENRVGGGASVVGYKCFRTGGCRAEHYKDRPPLERPILPGGCVDRFMRYVLGSPTRWYRDARLDLCRQYCRIYAHNGGAYDFTFVIAWLSRPAQQIEFRFHAIVVNSRVLALTIWRADSRDKEGERLRSPKYAWTFVDSVFLMPMSLADVGKSFNAGDKDAQKSVDFSLDTHERDPDWERYNRADCVTLFAALDSFGKLAESIGGSMEITAASTAMCLFRSRFLKEPVHRNMHFPGCKNGKCKIRIGCLHAFILDGYCGGRTEPFTVRFGKSFRGWDINSSYPSSMLESMPVGPARVYGRESWESYKRQRDFRRNTMIGFVRAEVFIPTTCNIPPLPCKSESGKLVFPVGHFNGVWTDEELALLDDETVKGRVVRIDRSVWFEKSRIFAEYVDALYAFRRDAKQKGNEDDAYKQGLSALAKILINALYGKTAERSEKEKIVSIRGGFDPMPGDKDSAYKEGRPLIGQEALHEASLWVVREQIDKDHIVPQLAAYVTSLSRIKLWLALRDAGKLGGTVYYTDSDSVRVGAPEGLTASGRDEWYAHFEKTIGVSDSELGKWSREHKGADLGGLHWRPKLYMLQDAESLEVISIKAKGIPKAYRTRENFDRLVAGQPVNIQRRMMARTLLKQGAPAPLDVNTHKTVRGEFDKRVVLTDGSTRPLEYAKRTKEERKKRRTHGARI